jgi:sulfite reductase beta subunit-like hemoprotein
MHIYNVGYGSYEESERAQLWHEKKFSQKHFEQMIAKIVADVLKNREEAEKETFQDVFPEVVQEL